ncbi:MAG: PEP-CTERM sorting domain-containing protein [Terracidiphilus sp.]
MKKQSLALLALATALAVTSVARADSFTFTFSDGIVSGSGTLTGTYQGSEVWLLTSGTGTFNDGSGSGSISLVGNSNYPSATLVMEADPSNDIVYDDQLSLFNGPNQYLTVDGLYFTYGSLDLNLYQLGGGPGYDGWFEGNGNGDSNGTFAITSSDINENPVPEPGSFLLLGTGFISLAGLLLRRQVATGLAL